MSNMSLQNKEQQDVIDRLLQLGFTRNEVRIFLNVYDHRRALPAEISRDTGINRSTVYASAKNLVDRGVLFEDFGANNRKYFVAKAPESISYSFENEEKEAKKNVRRARLVVDSLLQRKRNERYTLPKIQFISENRFLDFLYEQTPVWEASMKEVNDYTWWGFQDTSFPDRFDEWIRWYWKRASNKFNLKLISGDSKTEVFNELKQKYNRRILAPWSALPEFSSTLWVHGDYIVMFALDEHPNYLIQIRHRMLAENLRELFKKLWPSVLRGNKL